MRPSTSSKDFTHYLNDTHRFDISSKDPSSGISVDVVIRYLHWPRIEVCYMRQAYEDLAFEIVTVL